MKPLCAINALFHFVPCWAEHAGLPKVGVMCVLSLLLSLWKTRPTSSKTEMFPLFNHHCLCLPLTKDGAMVWNVFNFRHLVNWHCSAGILQASTATASGTPADFTQNVDQGDQQGRKLQPPHFCVKYAGAAEAGGLLGLWHRVPPACCLCAD